mmetsp:Transcript_33546/g.6082  ORF Transcript_33546/g.6082 Transcript_33546/m.6082 type:complete len:129 (+) Transcript_33546:312-698(+)
MDHPNIIKFYEVYEDFRFIHIIMQHCTGGELLSRLISKGSYTEKEASGLMFKLMLACNYLHKQGVVHRDIKPENIIFESQDEDAEVKIIDFGLASKFSKGDSLSTIAGTPSYMAPEVFRQRYGTECDV